MMSDGEKDTFRDNNKTATFSQQHLQSVNNSLSNPQPVKGFVFWNPPKQRQRWGDPDCLPHINWGDLFFDLFYVAAAYNLAYVLYNSPSAEGFLFFTGLFGPILLEWFQRTLFDARFLWGDDPFHRAFEVLHLCALSFAVVHIRPVSTMIDPTQPDMFYFSAGVVCLAVLNIYRSLEVIFAVVGEDAAKHGERRWLVGFTFQLVFYLGASVKSGIAHFGGGEHTVNYDYGNRGLHITNACSRILNPAPERDLAEGAEEKDRIPIILLLCGWSISMTFVVIRAYFVEQPNGEHKKFNVPMNVEYLIHRFGELVMLLLGESILSILIVEPTQSVEYKITLYAAILSVVLLQYCHYRYQPHSASMHAIRRSIKGGAIYFAIMIIYCHALVAVGASFKLFLSYHNEESLKYNNLRHLVKRFLAGAGEKTKFYALENEQATANMFCISMVIVWFCLESAWITHHGKDQYWSYRMTKPGLCVGLLRIVWLILMGTISIYTTQPENVTLIGLALICAEIATSVITDYFWSKQFGDVVEDGHWPNVTEPGSVSGPKESAAKQDDLT